MTQQMYSFLQTDYIWTDLAVNSSQRIIWIWMYLYPNLDNPSNTIFYDTETNVQRELLKIKQSKHALVVMVGWSCGDTTSNNKFIEILPSKQNIRTGWKHLHRMYKICAERVVSKIDRQVIKSNSIIKHQAYIGSRVLRFYCT